METCADCGKPINMNDPSYYRRDPSGDIGKSFHSYCGDPFGTKAKDARIAQLEKALQEIADNAFDVESAAFARDALRISSGLKRRAIK
jgi:hypothetical protein